MKKVLILAYFFPPANFAGSYRAASWAKYFHQYGYYPIIVTRQWNAVNDKYPTESFVTDEYEVHYLPYKDTLRDRLLAKYGYNSFKLLRRLLTASELLLRNVCDLFVPYSNFYLFAKQYLKRNHDCHTIIASGTPYQLFKYAYRLKKLFPYIEWIADYRDEWTTNVYDNLKNPFFNTVFSIDSFFEKKWVSTAKAITSVSQGWTDNISAFTKRPGYLVMNGFDEDDYKNEHINPYDEFTILYNGTLYPSQPIKVFLNALKQIIDKYNSSLKVKVLFPGIIDSLYEAREVVANQIREIMTNYENHYELYGRIPKKEIIDMQLRSHILLMVGHKDSNVRSVYSSKIFEYLACKKPILLCPGDDDVLNELIVSTNAGIIADTSGQAYDYMDKIISQYIKSGNIDYMPVHSEVQKYTRKIQAEKLISVIEKPS